MIGKAGSRVTITGLGCHVPERIMTNDDLREFAGAIARHWLEARA